MYEVTVVVYNHVSEYILVIYAQCGLNISGLAIYPADSCGLKGQNLTFSVTVAEGSVGSYEIFWADPNDPTNTIITINADYGTPTPPVNTSTTHNYLHAGTYNILVSNVYILYALYETCCM